MSLNRITNCLWLDGNTEEAVAHYTSIFPNSKIGHKSYYTKVGQENHGRELGSLLCVEFELDGVSFTAVNGGPFFKFTPAISFQVDCKDQTEVDHYYERLGEDGDTSLPCGWLKDKFGISWQIIPHEFLKMQKEVNEKQNERLMEEMFKMKKPDVGVFKAAFKEAA